MSEGSLGFHVGDFAFDAVERGDGLAEFFPLCLGRAAKSDAQRVLVVATKKIAQRGGKFAEIVYARIDFHMLRGKKWRIDGRLDDFAGAIGRHEQGGFIAQRRRKQAEGRDFRGGVHPDQFVADAEQR